MYLDASDDFPLGTHKLDWSQPHGVDALLPAILPALVLLAATVGTLQPESRIARVSAPQSSAFRAPSVVVGGAASVGRSRWRHKQLSRNWQEQFGHIFKSSKSHFHPITYGTGAILL